MDSVKAGIQPGTGTTSSTDTINNNTEKIKPKGNARKGG